MKLFKKRIVVLDILANAGGVTVSYFEQVKTPTIATGQKEVLAKLEPIMIECSMLSGQPKKYGCDMRWCLYSCR